MNKLVLFSFAVLLMSSLASADYWNDHEAKIDCHCLTLTLSGGVMKPTVAHEGFTRSALLSDEALRTLSSGIYQAPDTDKGYATLSIRAFKGLELKPHAGENLDESLTDATQACKTIQNSDPSYVGCSLTVTIPINERAGTALKEIPDSN